MFYLQTSELLEISSHPVLRVKSLLSRGTKNGQLAQTWETKKINCESFFAVLVNVFDMSSYLNFSSLERFPVYILMLANFT